MEIITAWPVVLVLLGVLALLVLAVVLIVVDRNGDDEYN
jgi:ABC-type transporter Mla subunit MlaD